MKKFLSGFLACAILMSLTISALAISGRMTIEVDPINIKVNGQTFAPTDINGKEVPVFAYDGTTYAPLRALAEAYGLEVGYDATSNMATVWDHGTPDAHTEDTNGNELDHYDDLYQSVISETDDEEYSKFKALWDVSLIGESVDNSGSHARYLATCIDDSINPSNPSHTMYQMMTRLAYEYRGTRDTLIMEFTGQGYGCYCTIGF